MVVIGIGANLTSPKHGFPLQTCRAASQALNTSETAVVRQSCWYETAPVPMSDQPWYVNGVVAVETILSPDKLLRALQDLEARFGRTRSVRDAPRVLDLDLIDYNGILTTKEEAGLDLPHPRMHERAFVLLPLANIAPDWRHPLTGATLQSLIAALPAEQVARRVAEGLDK